MTMDYQIDVVPEHVRVETLSLLAATATDTIVSWDVYPGREEVLKVVVVPLGLPVYRLSNGRTRSAQLELLDELGLDASFFSAGQENVDAQKHQHSLLEKFAREGGDSVTPIIDVLRSERQRNEIIISPSGVVLDGNRRLAAMRALYAENPQAFSSYANIKCAILPQLTADQALDMEVRLQMRPQTLLEYTWLDEAMTIEEAQQTRSLEQVAALMKKTKAQVASALASLLEARAYLSQWLQRPHAYHEVLNRKQLFVDIAKAIRGKTSEEIEATRRIAWTLDSSSELSGRVYQYNFVFTEKTDEVLSRVAEVVGGFKPVEPDLDAPEIAFDEVEESPHRAFSRAITDPGTAATIRDAVETVAQELFAEKANANSAANPLKLIRSVRSTLESVSIVKAAPATLNDAIAQLRQIEERAGELRALASGLLGAEGSS